MAIKFTNNASSKLTQALSANATSMHINAEDVSKFPSLTSGDYCLLTLVGDNGNHEIIKTTAISSDGTCTIVRAQDSTTAKAWDIDTRVELRITAEYLNSTADNEEITSSITNIESDITDIKNEINNIVDSIPLDEVTITRSSDGKLQVEDIAIGGDKSDLASDRGIFESIILKENDNLNTITTQGIYSAPVTIENSPGFASKILTIASGPQYTISQFALANLGTKLASRGRTTINENSVWQDWTNIITDNSIGDGITANNGIISVPEYEGATSSATATSGLVPPATSAERNNFLRGDGTWQQVDLSDYALKTELTKYLPLTGGTLTGNVICNSGTYIIKKFNTTFGTNPSSTVWQNGIIFTDKTGSTSSSVRYSDIRAAVNTSGDSLLEIGALSPGDGDTSKIQMYSRKNGSAEMLLTFDPVSTSNNRQIATTKWVNSKLSSYLPLTGGTITGTLTVNDWFTVQTGVRHNDTSGELLMCSGSTWNDSPSLSLYGSSHPTAPGDFILRAGEDSKYLRGKSDGQLIWDGKHIVRSVGGMVADATGNVNAPYLPINGSYTLNRPTEEFGVGIGTNWNTAPSFTLYGVGRTDGNEGMFSLRAKSSSSTMKEFIGRPSGQLTWAGKNIVRSVNGINADTNGNVVVSSIGAPNFNGGYTVGAEGNAPTNGYLFFRFEGHDGTYVLNIGGQDIFYKVKVNEHWAWSGLFPVTKGTYYKISGLGQYAAFYPSY